VRVQKLAGRNDAPNRRMPPRIPGGRHGAGRRPPAVTAAPLRIGLHGFRNILA